MAFPPPPWKLPLHRKHKAIITLREWTALAALADTALDGDTIGDWWNCIATALGMPIKTDPEDTITADEWNEAVNRATARHA